MSSLPCAVFIVPEALIWAEKFTMETILSYCGAFNTA
jgi:hypothetical protein